MGRGEAEGVTSPPTHGCRDGVSSGRAQSGLGCGSSRLGRGSWAKGREGVLGTSNIPHPKQQGLPGLCHRPTAPG